MGTNRMVHSGVAIGLSAWPLLAGDTLSVSALKELSIEDLANLSVTSASKTEERVTDTAAAVYVLTPTEIARSGAKTLPDALRLVPGMDVARVNGHDWAVSARGFNDLFANKLLVMVDGRTVYTPLFSGVYWQVQDVMLEDLDRVEVVRGPGGALWGANAVNGVINVVSKPARETTGLLVTGGGGNVDQGFGAVRYGEKVGDESWARVYGMTGLRDNFPLANGDSADDRWRQTQGGFRYDYEPDANRMLTLQGDAYGGSYDQTFTIPELTPPYAVPVEHKIDTFGANFLSRWSQKFSATSELRIQAYFDHSQQESAPRQAGGPAYTYRQAVDTVDLDVQQRWHWGERQEFVAGGGYRFVADDFDGSFWLNLAPPERDTSWANVFVQDEIQLVPEQLVFTAGAKLEHNDYTGWEVQPSARLRWHPVTNQTVWAAVSRAVRTPSRAEQDAWRPSQVIPGTFPGQPPTLAVLTGSRAFDSEELVAYELGYRVVPCEVLSLDATAFYHDYDGLRTLEPGAPNFGSLPQYVTLPVLPQNLMGGACYGTEWSVTGQPAAWWRLRLAYTLTRIDLDPGAASQDPYNLAPEGSSPENQVVLHSSWDLPEHVRFDAVFRWVSELPALNVPAYASLDLRVAWAPSPHWEFAVVGQNLLDSQHAEFGSVSLNGQGSAEVPRSVYAQLTFRY